MRMLSRIAALLLLPTTLCAGATGQTQSETKKTTGVITGRVTVAGKPIPNMIVTAQLFNSPGRATPSQLTDKEGRFQFTNLAPGQYQVIPRAFAYVYQGGKDPFQRGVHVNLDEGESLSDVDIALTQGAVITGRATDVAGRPVIGENVLVERANEQGGLSMWRPFSSTSFRTDDRGMYRLFGLPPGRYVISVGRPFSGNAGTAGTPRAYIRRTYHPDAAEEAKAKVIEVSEGGEVTGIDITVDRKGKEFSASGKIIDDVTGKPVPNVTFGHGSMVNGGTRLGNFAMGARSDRQGNFRLNGLTPGQYGVFVWGEPTKGYSDVERFQIIDKDVSGIEVRLKPDTTVSGFVSIEGVDAPEALSQVGRLQLNGSIIADGASSNYLVQINNDGSFHIPGVRPGKLHLFLNLSDSSRNFSLIRIERDGVVQPDLLSVPPGEPVSNLKVVLSYGTRVVRGQVKIENGELPAEATVLVLIRPAGKMTWSQGTRTDRNGRFLFEGLAPGEYDITVQPHMPAGRENVRQFRPVNQRVSVKNDSDLQVIVVLDLSRL